MLKNLIIISITVLLTAVVFVGGVVVGNITSYMGTASSTPVMKEEITSTAERWLYVNMLHKGKYEDLLGHLNLRLDGSILTIGQLLEDYPDEETKRYGYSILARIADQRSEHPYEPTVPEGRDKIGEILEHAQTKASEQDITSRER